MPSPKAAVGFDTYHVRKLLVSGLMESAKKLELFRREVDHHWPGPVPQGCNCQRIAEAIREVSDGA